jgi:hypothetical protein
MTPIDREDLHNFYDNFEKLKMKLLFLRLSGDMEPGFLFSSLLEDIKYVKFSMGYDIGFNELLDAIKDFF